MRPFLGTTEWRRNVGGPRAVLALRRPRNVLGGDVAMIWFSMAAAQSSKGAPRNTVPDLVVGREQHHRKTFGKG